MVSPESRAPIVVTEHGTIIGYRAEVNEEGTPVLIADVHVPEDLRKGIIEPRAILIDRKIPIGASVKLLTIVLGSEVHPKTITSIIPDPTASADC